MQKRSGYFLFLIILSIFSCVKNDEISANLKKQIKEYTDDSVPTKIGFYHELLNPVATKRTPAFDDYSIGNYRVRTNELTLEYYSFSKIFGKNLRAILIIGPNGPLWTYHVAAFFADNGKLKVNLIVMPHARITYKATGYIEENVLTDLANAIKTMKQVKDDDPPTYGIPVLFSLNDNLETYHFDLLSDESSKIVLDKINMIFDKLEKTYSH